MCALALVHIPSVGAAAGEDLCQQTQARIDAIAQKGAGRALVELAPYFSVQAIEPLITRAKGSSNDGASAMLALGLSRHAVGLARLGGVDPTPPQKLPWSLGMLAMGNAAGTGTISDALGSGTPFARRRTAEALAQMEQKRPRMLLYGALRDIDTQVRLTASEVMVRHYSRRARRALLALLSDPSPPVVRRAAVALLGVRHRFRDAEINLLPPDLRLIARTRSLLRGRILPRRARKDLASSDLIVRRSMLGALVASRQQSATSLARLARRVRVRDREKLFPHELNMALTLLGDNAATKKLASAHPAEMTAAIEVLVAFAGAGAPYNQLDATTAGTIARLLEPHVVVAKLPSDVTARAIDAVGTCDAFAGLRLARARILGPEGDALRAAIELVARHGSLQDAKDLYKLAERSADARTRVLAWRAAADVCRR